MSKLSRPSHPELYGKVNNALAAIKAGRKDFGTMRHWPQDRCELGLSSTEELWNLLPELLNEIKKAKPELCYAGAKPPQRCYQEESAIKDEELWAFSWDSSHFGKKMYLKFVLTKDQRGEWHYFYVNCHASAPQ